MSGSQGAPVTEMFAFLCDNPPSEGGEGIVASILPGFGTTTFVCTRETNAERFKTLAGLIAQQTGKSVRLVRLEVVETLERWAP